MNGRGGCDTIHDPCRCQTTATSTIDHCTSATRSGFRRPDSPKAAVDGPDTTARRLQATSNGTDYPSWQAWLLAPGSPAVRGGPPAPVAPSRSPNCSARSGARRHCTQALKHPSTNLKGARQNLPDASPRSLLSPASRPLERPPESHHGHGHVVWPGASAAAAAAGLPGPVATRLQGHLEYPRPEQCRFHVGWERELPKVCRQTLGLPTPSGRRKGLTRDFGRIEGNEHPEPARYVPQGPYTPMRLRLQCITASPHRPHPPSTSTLSRGISAAVPSP